MPQNQPDTLMTRLKTETRELHTYAEKRALQQQIAAGTVDRAAFAAYLGQLYLAHDALESALLRSRNLQPEISAMATPERLRLPELERDLEFYGIDPGSLQPEAATTSFAAAVAEIERSAAVALLGALYVL
ncbi:MAG TPA: biliverdin-producing heme oxygenase, partial [Chondromyces sp.]|nr:biliverdin-producing heme oxygenase [Chondromyces sp.]